MFYSQFILAKKGPLGTIWIAAHLERKLRKNQVADTDIGVSVDSILFPEVPIALRLSSHLLLGVVRIYSRKVNYLFDDCSEALLKIKQAFRSTAVDLPPEESTAPYHSITLPETFDLDDFELPDNEIFQGNYVDHHISTKDQITLQDTMEGVVYSTSQFGLDERFGDGDTSQIGLDLDEDLFLEKVAAPRHAGFMLDSDVDPQASVQPMRPLQKDENNVGITDTSEAMVANGNGKQFEGLAGNNAFIESAQAPSTPGLVEEPNLSNVQKALVSDDHLESEDHNSTELEAIENTGNASSKSDHHGDKNAVDWSSLDNMNPDFFPVEENGHIMGDQEIKQAKPQGDLPSTSETVDHISSDRAGDLQNGVLSNNEPSIPSIGQVHSECREPQGVGLDETVASPSFSHGASDLESDCHKQCSGVELIPEESSLNGTFQLVLGGIPENDQALHRSEISNGIEISGNLEESCSPSNALVSNVVCPLESPGEPVLENAEALGCHEPKDPEILKPDEEMPSTRIHVLKACNSHLNQANKLSLEGDSSVVVPSLPSEVVEPCSFETSGREASHASGASTEVQGEGSHATDLMKSTSEVNQISEPISCEDIQADHSTLNGQPDNSKDTGENSNGSAVSDLPAPEKLLSVPDGPSHIPNDLLEESTPDKEIPVEGVGIKIISGKKRSFTESTLTLQSLNSVESFGKPQSERTAESVPDDDDLLSSILVGRRSSILKMKPTPPPPEVVSLKRPRTGTRVSASKRKVLMDDTMVLHGDTIRQQLTNTEDIRRVRKKAPCTRPEIWMIQKQFLEDEIFSQPISTGMSTVLICLHNQTYDLSGIRVSQNGEDIASFEAAKDKEFSERPNVINETETEGNIEDQQGENVALGFHDNDNDAQVQTKATTTIPEPTNLHHEYLGEMSEMEIDGSNFAAADPVEHAVAIGVESSSLTAPVSGDICNMSTGTVVQSAFIDETSGPDASLLMDGLCPSTNQMLDSQSVGKDYSVVDLGNVQGVDAVEVPETHDDNIVVDGTDSRTKYEETRGGVSVEIRADVHTDCFAPIDGADPSLATVSVETGGFNDLFVVTDDQAMEETTKNELGIVNEDEVLAAELGYDEKDPTSNSMCSEEPKPDCSYSVKLDVNVQNASLNDGEDASLNDVEKSGFHEAELQGVMDAETLTLDHTAIKDRDELENEIVGHDTEFLNVDDDEVAEDDEDCMPCAEETRILDNSGWSSRTRAVAKYLQTLFDKEAERGRKVIPMDNLLTGKTRKEASRMFFETLVLKTRDYIHVEQVNPFDNVNIKPRVKLMKSDF